MKRYYHMTSADGSGSLPDEYGDEREDIKLVAAETARRTVAAGDAFIMDDDKEDWTGWILSVHTEEGRQVAQYDMIELLEEEQWMKFYSTAQVAGRLGLAESTVRGWCRRLNYNRMQGYMLTPEQVHEVARRAYAKPGRPRLSKSKKRKKRG